MDNFKKNKHEIGLTGGLCPICARRGQIFPKIGKESRKMIEKQLLIHVIKNTINFG
jgi:hypothetical protein